MIDRQRLGEALVKGPFTAIYPGGIYAGTGFYDAASTVFYPYSTDVAKAELAAAGLADTDGDGILNFPAGTADGANVEITLLANADYATDKNLAEGVVAMAEQVGLRVIPNILAGNDHDAARDGGKFDWRVWRNSSSVITVVQLLVVARGAERVAEVGVGFDKAGVDRGGAQKTCDCFVKAVEIIQYGAKVVVRHGALRIERDRALVAA